MFDMDFYEVNCPKGHPAGMMHPLMGARATHYCNECKESYLWGSLVRNFNVTNKPIQISIRDITPTDDTKLLESE